MRLTRRIGLFGAAAALLVLSGISSAATLLDASLTINDVTAQSGQSGPVEIPIIATADQLMSATLVFTFDPTVFDGDLSVSVNGWDTVSDPPDVEPVNPEPASGNAYVDFNVLDGTVYIAIASNDPVTFSDEVLCVISGNVKGQLSATNYSLAWSTDDVEVNDAAPYLTDGILAITNEPPTWDQYPTSMTSVIEDYSIQPISVLASDTEGEALTYWMDATAPSWLSFNTTTLEMTGTPAHEDIGNHSATLWVSDGVNSASVDVYFEVTANQPPSWVDMPTEVTVLEGSAIDEITVSASDPEGDELTYVMTSGPGWITFADGKLTGTPGQDDVGQSVVTLTVNDTKNVANPVSHEINFTVEILYGDVTGNFGISAFDASKVLKYVVKKITEIDIVRADVSRELETDPISINSFDAALILYKVVNPLYLFPVQGGFSPLDNQPIPTKLASATPASLEWVRTSDGWALNASGTGPMGADLVLRMPESASLSSDAMFDYARDGEVVTIAAAAVDGSELFRVNGTSSAPEVVSATLNGAEATVAVPMSFDLRQNTPNPFNPSTTIAFSLPESAPVTLAIYDVNGRMVRTLVSGERAAGMHEVVWNGMDDNGRAVASGVYVYRLAAGNDVSTRRLALIR